MRRLFYKFYGVRANIDQLQEECGELIAACNKYKRNLGFGYLTSCSKKKAFENLIEEIADVENCRIAIKDLLEIDQAQIDKIIKEKDDRIAKRIIEKRIEESKG